MSGYFQITLWCAALYIVAELQNRWLALAFALVGFAWLAVNLRKQASAGRSSREAVSARKGTGS